MKSTFYILCLYVLIFFIEKPTAQTLATGSAGYNQLLQMTQEAIENCYVDSLSTRKIELTEDSFAELAQGSRTPSRNTKCLRYCIMKKSKLLDDDNYLDTTVLSNLFEKLYSNVVGAQELMQSIKDCNSSLDDEPDRCERAHTATKCLLEKLRDKGIRSL